MFPRRSLACLLIVGPIAASGCGTLLSLDGGSGPGAPDPDASSTDGGAPIDDSALASESITLGDAVIADDGGADANVRTNTVTCAGGSECDRTNNLCCAKGPGDLRCVDTDVPTPVCNLFVYCDQTSDCKAGEKCWLQNNPRSTQCRGTAPGPNAVVVCKTDADCGGNAGSCRKVTCTDYPMGTCGGDCAIP